MDGRPVENENSLTYSVVIELENATTVCWDEVRGVLQSLTSEIQSSPFRGAAGTKLAGAEPVDWRPQILFCHADEDDRSGPLRDELSREFPLLADVARISCLAVPGGRYYELKNAGIAQADGEVIILLDSDRKYADLKSSSRFRRMIKACETWYKLQVRSVRRVISLHRHVQMPWWEVPGAVLLGTLFALLVFLGQAPRALGLIAERVETVPAYAEHH